MANSISTPWPAHPQPLSDELFSSWMIRSARCNGRKLRNFICMMAPSIRCITKNIDSFVSPQNLALIASKMKTSEQRAYQTTLDSYSGVLFECASIRTRHKQNILSVGETRNHLHYQQYCPLCLSEGEPYYRRSWRISFITVCVRHHCQLLDRCTNCNSPVMPMANEMRHKHLIYKGKFTICHKCNTDLKKLDVHVAHDGVVKDTKYYLEICDKGIFQPSNDAWVYSFSFFCLLRHMIRVYVESQGASAFVGRFINPDRLPLSVRFAALKDMEGIFQRWPDGFITYCQERGISYSSISPMAKTNGGVVPYWVEEAIKKHIYFPNIEPSDVSVLAAIDVMKRDGLRASISSVNRFMGFTDSRVIKKVIKTVRES